MKIQIAGPDCIGCKAVEANVRNACADLNLVADISHVYDEKDTANLGVTLTPTVLVDGKIVISGKVPTVADIKKLLSDINKMHHAVSGWEED